MLVKVDRVYEIKLELESVLEFYKVWGVVRLDMFVGLLS